MDFVRQTKNKTNNNNCNKHPTNAIIEAKNRTILRGNERRLCALSVKCSTLRKRELKN